MKKFLLIIFFSSIASTTQIYSFSKVESFGCSGYTCNTFYTKNYSYGNGCSDGGFCTMYRGDWNGTYTRHTTCKNFWGKTVCSEHVTTAELPRFAKVY